MNPTDAVEFRTGRKLGRTVYMRTPDKEHFIGIFDEPRMAAFACNAMNKAVREQLTYSPDVAH